MYCIMYLITRLYLIDKMVVLWKRELDNLYTIFEDERSHKIRIVNTIIKFVLAAFIFIGIFSAIVSINVTIKTIVFAILIFLLAILGWLRVTID